MDYEILQETIRRAKTNDEYFDQLKSGSSVKEVEDRVLEAISWMSEDEATGQLMTAPSRNHCPRTSCGISSMISDEE
jgi:hypothetical protein